MAKPSPGHQAIRPAGLGKQFIWAKTVGLVIQKIEIAKVKARLCRPKQMGKTDLEEGDRIISEFVTYRTEQVIRRT
jgi:hypothetical protein